MAHRLVVFLAILATAVTGCNKSTGNIDISDKRTVPAPAAGQPSEAKASAPAGMPPGMGAMAGTAKQVHAYEWTAPQGWETVPSTPMRMANFKIGGDTECYLTVLSGAAGGTEMNINRWRTQMGQEEKTFTPEELAALPKVTLAGKDGMLVEIAGTYASMKGQPTPNSLMLVGLADMGGETLFVKMVGPEASVKIQRDNLLAFCSSLKQSEKAVAPGDITAPASGAACPMPGMGGSGAVQSPAAGAACPAMPSGAAPGAPSPAAGAACPVSGMGGDAKTADSGVSNGAAPVAPAALAAPATETAPGK